MSEMPSEDAAFDPETIKRSQEIYERLRDERIIKYEAKLLMEGIRLLLPGHLYLQNI